jgi:hypothetical protein
VSSVSGPATATSPANTAPLISKALWKAPQWKAPVQRMRSSATINPESFHEQKIQNAILKLNLVKDRDLVSLPFAENVSDVWRSSPQFLLLRDQKPAEGKSLKLMCVVRLLSNRR